MKKSFKLCLAFSFLSLVVAGCSEIPFSPSEQSTPNNNSTDMVNSPDSTIEAISQDDSSTVEEQSSTVESLEDSTVDTSTDDDSTIDESTSEESSSEESESEESSSEEANITKIEDAKHLNDGDEVTIQGQVTKILYNSSHTTMPYVMVNDDTGGIALYSKNYYDNVDEGDIVTVSGKYSLYKGTPEISEFTIDNVEEHENVIPESWISESTVTDLLSLEVTPDNVGKIYKIPCIPVQGDYKVYYLHEVEGDNSLQSYSQSSYSEYTFLNQYLDSPCELLIQLGIPKSSNNALSWRVHPLSYVREYAVDNLDKLKGISTEPFANFTSLFFESGKEELPNKSKQLSGATFSYSVDNTDIASITSNGDSSYLNLSGVGNVTLTCTIKLGTSKLDVTNQIEIKAKDDNYTASTVENLRSSAQDGDIVVLEGYVVGMVYDAGTTGRRKNAFYLMDGTGTMYVDLSQEMADKINFINGEKVVVEGEFDIYPAACNTKKVLSGKVLYHDCEAHDLPLSIGSKTFEEMYDFVVDNRDNRAGDVFFMDCIITKQDTQYGGTQYYVCSLDSSNTNKKNIYHASGADLSYLDAHLDTPLTILMGIRDRKPAQGSTELADGGYYRYDIIDGYYTLIEQ